MRTLIGTANLLHSEYATECQTRYLKSSGELKGRHLGTEFLSMASEPPRDDFVHDVEIVCTAIMSSFLLG